MPVSPSPEIVPALDEARPQIGPNLAADPAFCRVVLDYCYKEHVYPQILQQQRLWPVWQRIDDAYRVKGQANDLDIAAVDPILISTDPGRKGQGGVVDQNDGYSSRVYPATLHTQVTTKVDLHMSIAWDDGLPVAAVVPDHEYEHPLYNPTTQSVEAANRLLQDCARDINLKREDRKGRGAFAKYGHAWAAPDFQYELEDVPLSFQIPPNPQLAQQMLMDFSQRFQSNPQIDQARGVATWMQRVVKTMQTNLTFLRVDDVFIDQTLPVDMDRQLCPTIRSRVTRAELFGRDYDPDKNPFGYLNTQQALTDNSQQWAFDFSDQNYRDELQKKWGLSIQGNLRPKNSLKQKWVMYPMLAITQDPKTGAMMLDNGDGVPCPTCAASGKVTVQGPTPPPQLVADSFGNPAVHQPPPPDPETHDCPSCQGRMKVYLQPQRYVVEAFGNLGFGNSSATCLRIQRLVQLKPGVEPKVPLLFTANLTEDTAGAIPLGKAEASLKACDQEATALNFWNDIKNGLTNPPWMVPEGSMYINTDLNRANRNIEGSPDEYQPMRAAMDATNGILQFQQACRADVMQINGVNEQLLGIVSSGRRPATELQNAFDAGKMPITIEVDQYGEQILAPWAQFHLDNIEAWADRAWVLKQTGRTTFGKVQLFSAVATEFMKRQAMVGNLQYIAQMVAPIPGANLSPVLGALCRIMKLPINPDEVIPDGGLKKARADGMRIVTQLLGQAAQLFPQPQDPHAIYIEIFEQALMDPYWQQNTPETLPLLQQRLQMQIQLQMQQQMAQMQAQQRQLMASQPKGPDGKGGRQMPALPPAPPANSGGQNQQTMGAAQS